MPALTYLNLSDNKIEIIPADICQLIKYVHNFSCAHVCLFNHAAYLFKSVRQVTIFSLEEIFLLYALLSEKIDQIYVKII